MIIAGDQPHRYVIHDRDSIYSEATDRTLEAMGLTVLRTQVRAPQVNSCCECLAGTIRRECLDFSAPLTERHLREVLGAGCSMTTAAAHIRAWDRESPILRLIERPRRTATNCPLALASWPRQFGAGSITRMASN